MQLKRVVVTGLGALTPIGNGIQAYWEGLVNGKSGAAPVTYYDAENVKVKFACELKGYAPLAYFDRQEARKLDRFAQSALVSSDAAIVVA
ncbi:MAG: beta-ketoacyl synthase N-terminal-like domain-containing protein, partial [Flavobacteriaceae bacterium]